MSSTNRGPGRPPRPDPETLQRRRDFLLLNDNGVHVSVIAQRYNLAQSRVFDILRDARADAAAEQALSAKQPAVASADQPKPKQPRMNRRMLLDRAWSALNLLPFKLIDDGMQMAWLRAVVAIHECGDGTALQFGPRNLFNSLAQFARALGRSEADVATFFDQGVLLEVDGGGVALPSSLGLLPRVPSEIRPRKAAIREQREIFTVVSGGRSDPIESPSDSWNIPPPTPGISPISQESDSWNIPPPTPGISPISQESSEIARAAAAAANAKDNCDLASASATETPALDSGEMANIPGVDSGEITASDSRFINSKRSPVSALAAELADMVKSGRVPSAKDIGDVQRWSDAGDTAQTMRDVIQIKMAACKSPPSSLHYFDGPMRDARDARRGWAGVSVPQTAAPSGQPTAPAAAPRPALSPAEQALKEELHALWQRAHTGRKSRLPPVFSTYRLAVSNGHEPNARRWLTVYKGCLAMDSLGDLPEFLTYLGAPAEHEATMLEIEEELTAPDPPQAAD